jgi:hypothetical protein
LGVARLAEDLAFDHDDGIGTEHDLSRISPCDNLSLVSGEAFGMLNRRLAWSSNFRDVRHIDRKWNPGIAQQFRATRRS